MGIALFSLPPGIVHRDYVGGVLPVQVRPTEWLPLDHTGALAPTPEELALHRQGTPMRTQPAPQP